MRILKRFLTLFVVIVLPIFITCCEENDPEEAVIRSVYDEMIIKGYAESGDLERFMDDVEKTREKLDIQNISSHGT